MGRRGDGLGGKEGGHDGMMVVGRGERSVGHQLGSGSHRGDGMVEDRHGSHLRGHEGCRMEHREDEGSRDRSLRLVGESGL